MRYALEKDRLLHEDRPFLGGDFVVHGSGVAGRPRIMAGVWRVTSEARSVDGANDTDVEIDAPRLQRTPTPIAESWWETWTPGQWPPSFSFQGDEACVLLIRAPLCPSDSDLVKTSGNELHSRIKPLECEVSRLEMANGQLDLATWALGLCHIPDAQDRGIDFNATDLPERDGQCAPFDKLLDRARMADHRKNSL